MELSALNPFLRFAAEVCPSLAASAVKVTDCRIFYVEEGCAQIHIEDTVLQLQKDSLFYCPGGSIYTVKAQPELRLLCLNFDLTRNHEQEQLPIPVCSDATLWERLPVYFEPVENSLLNRHLLIIDGFRLRSSILELVQEHKKSTPYTAMLTGSLLKTLLLRLHQLPVRALPPQLVTVKNYIRSHYSEDITNQQLGDLVGYHKHHLNRTFYTYTGMTLHEYLNNVRLQQAEHLILNTALPLSAIAEEVGLRSYPHFSGLFKAAFGCSPAHYRHRHQTGI